MLYRALLISLLMLANLAHASGKVHWTYGGESGAEHWAELSPDFHICNGANQSPIDLSEFIEAELPPINFFYQPGGNEIINNGHTVQVNFDKGSRITLNGREFELKQFHFHAPSENHINGKSYPLEVHLVHANATGSLAVIGVMFEEGAENKTLAAAWASMPKEADQKMALAPLLLAEGMLPASRDYYYFSGSLTTPPCSEGVRWLVMKNSITASREQIDAFVRVLHEPNNRPLQRLNARAVLK